jgi:hypothetical protein
MIDWNASHQESSTFHTNGGYWKFRPGRTSWPSDWEERKNREGSDTVTVLLHCHDIVLLREELID